MHGSVTDCRDPRANKTDEAILVVPAPAVCQPITTVPPSVDWNRIYTTESVSRVRRGSQWW